MRRYLFILLAFCLMACNAPNGPQTVLDNMAKALETNNTQAFIAQIDMGQYANNYIKSLARNDEALSSLNAIGQIFGMGNLDELIGSVVDMKARLTDEFNRGVATGELMAQCRISIKPDCPWVPDALRKATVINLDANAAVAKITTPAQITSWLALRQINNQWMVVGQAALEGSARNMAQTPPAEPAPGAKGATRL